MADDPDRLAHARVGSYFLGPKAENFQILSDIFSHVLNDQRKARQQYMPDDPAFITAEMIQTEGFQESVQELQEYVSELSGTLAATSIPFWSPRYNGHMNMDTSLASIVGCKSQATVPNSEIHPFCLGWLADLGSSRHDHHDVQPQQRCHRSQPLHHQTRERSR